MKLPPSPLPLIPSDIGASITENPGPWFLAMVIFTDTMNFGDQPVPPNRIGRWEGAHCRFRRTFYGRKRATAGQQTDG